MGRDKSRIRLGRRTLLQHVRIAAETLGLPVRVIRRDAVPRCGPLGGIYTGLQRSRADFVMFLACDMPFISPAFLRKMLKQFQSASSAKKSAAKPLLALFARADRRAGFPCILSRQKTLPIVTRQIAESELSLQSLARTLRAKTIRPPQSAAEQLFNVNHADDLKSAVIHLKTGIKNRRR
jgi:molybdopterin-guanine dinucleotide biosynthesis protein A